MSQRIDSEVHAGYMHKIICKNDSFFCYATACILCL